MKRTTGTRYGYTARGAWAARRWLLAAMVGLMVAAITTGLVMGEGFRGKGDDDLEDAHGAYAIGLWGDMPYSDVQALTGVPNLITDMNKQDLAFTVHDGDLKGGNGIANSVTHHLFRRPVHAGIRFFQCPEGTGHLHTRRQ